MPLLLLPHDGMPIVFAVARGRSCPLRVNKCWKRQVGFNFAVVAHALGHEPDIFILPSAKCIRDAGSELPPRIQRRAQDCWQVKTKGAVLLLVSFCRHRKHARDQEAAYLHLLGLLRATHIEAGFDPSSLDDVMAEHTHLCTIGSTCGGLCGCLGRIRTYILESEECIATIVAHILRMLSRQYDTCLASRPVLDYMLDQCAEHIEATRDEWCNTGLAPTLSPGWYLVALG